MFTFAYLLLNFVGVAMKWWAMTTQMTRISNVGIKKFVTLAHTTQVFWKEGKRSSIIIYYLLITCQRSYLSQNNRSFPHSRHHQLQNWQNHSHHQLERSTCTQTCRSSCAGWLCWTSWAPWGEGREPNRPELSENSWHVNSIGQLWNSIGQLLKRRGFQPVSFIVPEIKWISDCIEPFQIQPYKEKLKSIFILYDYGL